MKRIILIDAYGQIYRAFFAVRGLTNRKGEPVNALYGIARFLLGLEENQSSDFGAVAFDKGKCRRRCTLLPEYKAQRPPMPDDLRQQIEPIKTWFHAFGWPLLEEEGFEADDLIACIATLREETPVSILSYDKDLTQLVNDQVTILNPEKNNVWQNIGKAEVESKFGIPPEHIVDYLALIGDASDNIRGVDGIGPKTAVKLIQQFGALENIFAHLEECGSSRLQESLRLAKDLLQRNRELIRLDRDCLPNWSGLEGIRRRKPDWQSILTLAEEQNFRTILDNVRKKLAKQNPEQLLLF
ncbi:MAG: 5'-3' exonuclease H3TH domain-containing protein [Lentisphaeria bacterium]